MLNVYAIFRCGDDGGDKSLKENCSTVNRNLMVKNNEHGESNLISTVEKCLDYSIFHIAIQFGNNYRPLKIFQKIIESSNFVK